MLVLCSNVTFMKLGNQSLNCSLMPFSACLCQSLKIITYIFLFFRFQKDKPVHQATEDDYTASHTHWKKLGEAPTLTSHIHCSRLYRRCMRVGRWTCTPEIQPLTFTSTAQPRISSPLRGKY